MVRKAVKSQKMLYNFDPYFYRFINCPLTKKLKNNEFEYQYLTLNRICIAVIYPIQN